MGTLTVNMSQLLEKFCVTSDNIHLYDNMVKNKGSFFTLDARPYMEELNLFGIFYTFKPE
jgi:hypothetical protein